MIEIISHRGYWLKPEEKNTLTSFKRALDNGFGIETDFRDSDSRLAISHDLAESSGVQLCEQFMMLLKQYRAVNLAINIKSDGLSNLILDFMQASKTLNNCFVFDMSGPSAKDYITKAIPFYTRQSEYELEPIFYAQASGVWLDSFESHWFDHEIVKKHLACGKKVALVSSELHGRDCTEQWRYIKENGIHNMSDVKICTDYPEVARKFFL